MKLFRRTDDPDICFTDADTVMPDCQLGDYGIVEFRIDTRKGKFIMTPIMRDGSEGPVLDVTAMYEKFHREYGDSRRRSID